MDFQFIPTPSLNFQVGLNLGETDKGSTTVVMDTLDKINDQRGRLTGFRREILCPFGRPIVSSTANKVNDMVNTLFSNRL